MHIGVLTSGGDAPGMNAAVAGACAACEEAGADVLGIARGFAGLAEDDATPLTTADARRHLHEAGTWLRSSRHPALGTPEGLAQARAGADRAGLDALVVIGGGGSLLGARALADAGLRIAFVPATIDNDIPGTPMTLGHDSAVHYAVGVVDQLRITGRSLPGRAFLVQTLGGDTRELARAVAGAAAVNALLLDDGDEELRRAAEILRGQLDAGEAIAVMPEGIGNAVEIGARLERVAGVRVRATILGHAQRGAAPTARDRALGLAAGRAAVASALAGRTSFVALDADGPHVTELATGRPW